MVPGGESGLGAPEQWCVYYSTAAEQGNFGFESHTHTNLQIVLFIL